VELPRAIMRLRRNAVTFRSLLQDLGDMERLARWTPAPHKWSLLIVANHLADEERDDFKVRLDHTLHKKGTAWPTIDPEGWVTSRDYAAQNYEDSVRRFLAERDRSIAWLEDLRSPDWGTTHDHPTLGTVSAGDLMAAWIDHDHQHMRQILNLLHESLCEETAPYNTSYAGEW
jgi:hypothetical protein